MKDPLYRAKCIEKAINKQSSLDVMLGLADIAYDIFQLSLKNQNKRLTKQEIQRMIRELNEAEIRAEKRQQGKA